MLRAAARQHLLPARRSASLSLLPSPRPLDHQGQKVSNGRVLTTELSGTRHFMAISGSRNDDSSLALHQSHLKPDKREDVGDGVIPATDPSPIGSHEQKHEHAVISAFDLFSIGGAFATQPSIAHSGIGQTMSDDVLGSWA